MLRRLRLFGHIVRSDSDDAMRTIHVPSTLASTTRRRSAWRRPRGRPRQTWLRTVENIKQNLGPWSVRHRAYDRKQWCEIVETATLLQVGACYMMMMMTMMVILFVFSVIHTDRSPRRDSRRSVPAC